MAEADPQVARIRAILEKHKDKNFVQRILRPYDYPDIPVPDKGKGMRGTHLMSWGTNDEGAAVYPQIIQDQKTGEMVRLSPKQAYLHAMDSGEYIPFGTPDEAGWFSENYKKVWGPIGE